MRRLAILLLLAASLFGANLKLYLKDGDHQLVREYQVLDDRVRYSVDRADWEELPDRIPQAPFIIRQPDRSGFRLCGFGGTHRPYFFTRSRK